jgi:hypothetical protein
MPPQRERGGGTGPHTSCVERQRTTQPNGASIAILPAEEIDDASGGRAGLHLCRQVCVYSTHAWQWAAKSMQRDLVVVVVVC